MYGMMLMVRSRRATCLCTCFTATISAKSVSIYSLISSTSPLYDISDSAYLELNIVGTKESKVVANGQILWVG